jgi:hypothetical protein
MTMTTLPTDKDARAHREILEMKSKLISVGGTDTLEVDSCRVISNWSGNEYIPLPDSMGGVVEVYFKKDDKHIQYFRSREELDEFISQLKEYSNRAWG